MKTLSALLAITILAGCATTGSNYVPLVDMQGRDAGQFRRDTIECQQYAKQRADAAQGAVAGAILGGLLVSILSPRGYKNYGAQQGAIAGGVGGAVQANETQQDIIKRCLAGRGYSVLN